jgi:pilus assembly protein CpaC
VASSCSPNDSKRQRPIVYVIVIALLVLGGHAGYAQPPRARDLVPMGGQASVRPMVPLTTTRPYQGTDETNRWDLARPGGDNQPVTNFVESYKSSDAMIEVLVGQGRMLTLKRPIMRENGVGVVALGDPSVLSLEVMPTPRMLRLTGLRAGITDLTIVTDEDETLIFEVHVIYDIPLLTAQLSKVYPDALLRLSQLREHIVLEGQARTTAQIAQIEQTLRAMLASVQVGGSQQGSQGGGAGVNGAAGPRAPAADDRNGQTDNEGPNGEYDPNQEGLAGPEVGGRPSTTASFPKPQVVNLMQVIGLQQVMLQVRMAELNRTAVREMGADVFVRTSSGTILGTQIGGANVLGGLGLSPGAGTTAYGIFPSGRLEIMLRALRDNAVLSVLAEPNLIALHGEEASFLAGGEFPVPVQQGIGGAGNVSVEWKEFGVLLNFTPFILDNGTIRLRVAPEVSTIDNALGTTLVVGGDPIPGVNTRRVTSTVELKEGQTLVLAGLLQVTIEGRTQRVPGLGDLPYLGPMFSNTKNQRVEKELIVFVTPYFASPLDAHEVPCLPGSEIQDPNDLEFYLLNRIEGQRGRSFRATNAWADPWHLVPLLHLERDFTVGPIGFVE